MNSSPVEQNRRSDRNRLADRLAPGQIAVVSEDDATLFVINGKGALGRAMADAIQRGIESRREQEQAND